MIVVQLIVIQVQECLVTQLRGCSIGCTLHLCKLLLVLRLHLIFVLVVKPLIAFSVLYPKEAMLDHNEEHVLYNAIYVYIDSQ